MGIDTEQLNKPYEITIITVCFNSEKTIRKTIESLLNQTYKNFEYIVIDGNSSDGTVGIIKEYEYLFHNKIEWKSEPDGGIYDAMNKGIQLAKGQFIGVLNSDDWYEQNTIRTVRDEILKNKNIDMFYGYIRLIKDGVEYMVRRNNYKFILEGTGLIQHPACFISKKVYDEVGGYDASYKICADQDMILRVIKAGKKYYAIDAILTNFLIGGATYLNDTVAEQIRFKVHHGIMSKRKGRYLFFSYKIKLIAQKIFNFMGIK